MKRLRPQQRKVREEIRKAIDYFQTNKERMRYAEFRRQGLLAGSGVVEAACKTVIGLRLKQSGMRWSVAGASAIIALRCCQLSGRWEEFWESRAAGRLPIGLPPTNSTHTRFTASSQVPSGAGIEWKLLAGVLD
jgi:hypothetical protein